MTAADWYQRTGHCHGCGQPGRFCLCDEEAPCGCADLHPVGSGIGANAAAVFADQPAPADDGQEALPW